MDIQTTFQLQLFSCSSCGITYGVPVQWEAERRRTHAAFWCPNGHRQYFPGESSAEKAQRDVREIQARLDKEANRRLAAERERDKAVSKAKRLQSRG